MSKQRIFITGGASGLGEALAERYAQDNWSVCIGDINVERGEAVAAALKSQGVRSQFLRCDVTKDADLEAAAQWLMSNWDGVDIVVNNAGVALAGHFEDTALENWNWIIDINLLGVVRGCKVFVKIFQAQGSGQFINIASAAGLIHLPRMAAYNASKAAVIALSETLRFEYPKVKVSVVCPTFFKTRLAETLRTSDPSTRAEMTKLVTYSKVPASFIANAIYKDAAKNIFMILPDREARKARLLKRVMSEVLYFKAVGLQMKLIRKKLAKSKRPAT